jgi:glycolate oxidase
MIRAIKEIATRHDVTLAVYGHISDGNLHPNMLFDRRNPEEVERVHRAASEIFAAAVKYGGTLSGEHGIGLLKKDFLGMALSPEVIEAMKRVKAAFDPNGIMNPGKMFPSV